MSAVVWASVEVMQVSEEEDDELWGWRLWRDVQLNHEKEKLGAAETRAARTAKMPAMAM